MNIQSPLWRSRRVFPAWLPSRGVRNKPQSLQLILDHVLNSFLKGDTPFDNSREHRVVPESITEGIGLLTARNRQRRLSTKTSKEVLQTSSIATQQNHMHMV